MIKRLTACSISLLALNFQGAVKTQAAVPVKPNIIFIYADDLGRGMLSFEGQKIVKTPNIDRLAEEGVRFNNVRGCMFCAPARASVLTGYHDCHGDKWKITSGGAYVKVFTDNSSPEKISEKLFNLTNSPSGNTVTLAEVFKKAGYKTGQIGKLEWGFSVSMEEMKAHGWDYYYGYLDHVMCHGYYPPFVFETGRKIDIQGNTRADCGKSKEKETDETFRERWNMEGKNVYSQDLFIEKILEFIRENKKEPFFLYYPAQLPHGPVAIPKIHADYLSDDRLTPIEKEYASMVKLLDDQVGMVLNELKKLNLDKNTLVLFSSDNGHEIYYTQEGHILKPVRNMKTGESFDQITTKFYSEIGGDVFNGNDGMAGLKYNNWEGGLRVPLLMRWPGKISKGKVLNNLVANYDLLPTLADLLNVSLVERKDGISLWPLIRGKKVNTGHEYVVNASMMGAVIITKDGWKLRHFYPKNVFQLFFLPDDYREEQDLAAKYPKKVNELKEILLNECNGDFLNGYFTYQRNIIPPI